MRRVRSASAQRTSRLSDSLRTQIRDELDVFIAPTGQIHNDRLVPWQLARETNRGHNCMRRFERRNDSLQFGAKLESFESFGITRSDVFGAPIVVEKRVLRADRGVIEAGRDRMRRCDLTVRVLKYVRHRALQNPDPAAAAVRARMKSRGVFA